MFDREIVLTLSSPAFAMKSRRVPLFLGVVEVDVVFATFAAYLGDESAGIDANSTLVARIVALPKLPHPVKKPIIFCDAGDVGAVIFNSEIYDAYFIRREDIMQTMADMSKVRAIRLATFFLPDHVIVSCGCHWNA